MLFVNAYLARTDLTEFLSGLEQETPVQAYIVYDDQQGLVTDGALGELPSNTLGVVMVPFSLRKRHQPRRLGFLHECNQVMCLNIVFGICIPPDFVQESFKCLTKLRRPGVWNLYVAICGCLKLLQIVNHGDRAMIRHVGRAMRVMERLLNPGLISRQASVLRHIPQDFREGPCGFSQWRQCHWCDYWIHDPYEIDWIKGPLCDLCCDWHLGEGRFVDLADAARASDNEWCGLPYEPTAATRCARLLLRWFPQVLTEEVTKNIASSLVDRYEP